jgi:septal ring factor EnvC (AmiA/AmiB activator)
MDPLAFAKAASDLGVVGISLLVSGALAWALWKRETDGLTQLRSAIEALTRAVDGINVHNANTTEFLKKQTADTRILTSDLKDLRSDVNMIKLALVSVGAKNVTSPRD